MLESFSLTHVQYSADDIIGKPLAVASLVPIFILVSYATLLAAQRDMAHCIMLIGQLLNEIINASAKAMIKEPRPTSTHSIANNNS